MFEHRTDPLLPRHRFVWRVVWFLALSALAIGIAHGWTPRLAKHLEMGRQALHAARLDFRSPKLTRVFTAPLAADMRAFVLGPMGCTEAQLAEALAR